jgi:hypothetical protein
MFLQPVHEILPRGRVRGGSRLPTRAVPLVGCRSFVAVVLLHVKSLKNSAHPDHGISTYSFDLTSSLCAAICRLRSSGTVANPRF